MNKLFLTIVLMSMIAYLSRNKNDNMDIYDWLLIILYTLFVGLRTSYNDTANYIRSFENTESLAVFLNDPNRMNVFHNPLFYAINAKFHDITNNYHIFFMVFALLNSYLIIRFLKKYSLSNYAYTILLFWGFGLGMFGVAAMKQITAMAILTLAYDALIDKKWFRFVIIVLVASLIHTYAILFIVLPFFTSKPWNWKTVIMIAVTGVIILTFNSTIASVLDYADAAGKSVADFEVFDGVQMNIFRVAVFGICPVSLLAFRKYVFADKMETEHELRNIYTLCNMSIISFMFVLLGRVNGANMFGRLATYFVFGDICVMGWILKQVFNRRSYQLLSLCSVILFVAFIVYDNRSINEYGGYASITLFQFLETLF